MRLRLAFPQDGQDDAHENHHDRHDNDDLKEANAVS